MKRVFNKALQRVSSRLGIKDISQINPQSSLIVKTIQGSLNNDIAYSKVSRLPLSEVKNMLKVPCPLKSQTSTFGQEQAIAIIKRLRQNFKVEEEAVCLKCERKCAFRSIPFKSMDYKPQTNNKSAVHDLIFYLLALSQVQQPTYSQLRWSAAFKVASSFEVLLKDYKLLSRQSLLYRQVFRQLDDQEHQFLNRKKSKTQKGVEEVQQKLKQRRIRLQKSPFQ